MNRHLHLRNVLGATLLALAMTAIVANAQQLGSPFGASSSSGSGAYTPLVPVSALARPWLDPSHFHISSTVSVGTGWSGSGNGTSALQVTSFAYQFTKPAWLAVSVGNSLGTPTFNGKNGMFLEGLTFGFKPWGNSIFQVQYKDVRSPLQLQGDPYFPSRW